jgi:tRNA A-37 threonylcarbamoyl transferase component Bud32
VTIPGHEILGELGRGGMGVVYKARQTKLNRLVALKMVLAGGHAGAAELLRFQTEAEAIARLQHPNIVQVYEVGEHEGKPFFSLEFCGGGSLEKNLAGTPLPAGEAAALLEVLARAVQAAHDKGVIHRDLKPANVLLADNGTPKITDFGLAKKLDEVGQTTTGAIMGTPSYMAPEQAGGRSLEIGPPADVYALGAILYECLTGRPPFKAATALDTMQQVVSDDPVPPTQLQSQTPRDLETICLKCLGKEPRKRYDSAKELADDLRRFLAGEPIVARPVGRVERGLKWVKRQTALAATIAATVLITAISFVVVLLLLADAVRSRDDTVAALGERDKALTQVTRALGERDKALAHKDHQLANSNLLLAQAGWNDNLTDVARERLAAVPPAWRGWEWYYLNRQYQGGLFTLKGHKGIVPSVAFSQDGPRLAEVTSVAFSPDGLRLATGSNDGTARVWDARTGESLRECKGHKGVVTSVAFSPDGLRLATGSQDGTARVWDARSGKPVLECKGHTDGVTSVAFSPDGLRLATGSKDHTARVWDARSGQKLLECKGHTAGVRSVAFSPDGLRLATAGGNDQTARVWDGRTLSEAEELEWRRWATRAEPDWHQEQFQQNQQKDRFAAAFHLDRMLAYLPSKRTELLRQRTALLEATLQRNKDDKTARLLLARTAWHSPALGPKDATDFLSAADNKQPFAQRTRGGLLLRQKKAAEAAPVLEAALKDRGDGPPPVEELLLAWSYLDTGQPDKAKALWAKLTAWLDGQQEAVRAADLAGTLPAGSLPGMAPLFLAPTHPRYSAFNWETWHEIDVLRRELGPRFAVQKP